jgi:hypothetical protein
MTQDELDSALRMVLRRATARAAAYGPDHITADFDAHIGDSPNGVPVLAPWGLAGLPAPGATLLVAALGGRSDRLHVVAAELPSARPAGLPVGGTALHDLGGNQVRLVNAAGMQIFSPGHLKHIRKIGKKLYLGGDPDQGGHFSPVVTVDGPSQVVWALVEDHDYVAPS